MGNYILFAIVTITRTITINVATNNKQIQPQHENKLNNNMSYKNNQTISQRHKSPLVLLVKYCTVHNQKSCPIVDMNKISLYFIDVSHTSADEARCNDSVPCMAGCHVCVWEGRFGMVTGLDKIKSWPLFIGDSSTLPNQFASSLILGWNHTSASTQTLQERLRLSIPMSTQFWFKCRVLYVVFIISQHKDAYEWYPWFTVFKKKLVTTAL